MVLGDLLIFENVFFLLLILFFFRFYLTDINPDNVVVNEELKISFIDIDNLIIVDTKAKGKKYLPLLNLSFFLISS